MSLGGILPLGKNWLSLENVTSCNRERADHQLAGFQN